MRVMVAIEVHPSQGGGSRQIPICTVRLERGLVQHGLMPTLKRVRIKSQNTDPEGHAHAVPAKMVVHRGLGVQAKIAVVDPQSQTC